MSEAEAEKKKIKRVKESVWCGVKVLNAYWVS